MSVVAFRAVSVHAPVLVPNGGGRMWQRCDLRSRLKADVRGGHTEAFKECAVRQVCPSVSLSLCTSVHKTHRSTYDLFAVWFS